MGVRLGGRQKGTPNKKTEMLQDIIERALGKSLPESLMDDVDQIKDPKERGKIKLGLMNYIYPQRKAIDVTTLGQPVSFIPDDLKNKSDEEIFNEYKKLVGEGRRG